MAATVEEARQHATKHGVAIEATIEDVAVTGIERDLAVLARNLIDNAVRFSPEGEVVKVSLAAENGEAVIRVADRGPGIPVRDQERIFERFYRIDPARSRATGGTGLGLAIVKHVVERHDGSVTVRSVLGEGATFEVRLPMVSG